MAKLRLHADHRQRIGGEGHLKAQAGDLKASDGGHADCLESGGQIVGGRAGLALTEALRMHRRRLARCAEAQHGSPDFLHLRQASTAAGTDPRLQALNS